MHTCLDCCHISPEILVTGYWTIHQQQNLAVPGADISMHCSSYPEFQQMLQDGKSSKKFFRTILP